MRTQGEFGINKPKRKPSKETNPANTLILDLQSPKLWESNFLMFKPASPRALRYDGSSKLIETGSLEVVFWGWNVLGSCLAHQGEMHFSRSGLTCTSCLLTPFWLLLSPSCEASPASRGLFCACPMGYLLCPCQCRVHWNGHETLRSRFLDLYPKNLFSNRESLHL